MEWLLRSIKVSPQFPVPENYSVVRPQALERYSLAISRVFVKYRGLENWPTSVTSTMRLSHKIPVTPWRATNPWAFRPRMALPLILGLSLFGLGEGLLVQSQWGATPWTVFAQGVSRHTSWSLGWSTAVISLVVLMAWFPLGERPGFGTIANLIIIAYVLDLVSTNLVVPHAYWLKTVYVVGAVVAIGVGSALY